MNNEVIPIVLSSSESFMPHCAAAMASILYNISDNYTVNFYILSYDITEISKKFLSKLTSIRKCTIDYPTFAEEMLDIFDGIKLPSHVSKMTYARILIPDILPHVDKAIFVDSDMIVRGDISQLYEKNMGNNVFAAVEDFNWVNISNRLWGTKQYYYNAGLLLINCSKLREIDYLNIIKRQVAINRDKYQICDQDLINDAFRGKIYRLSVTWNFYHGVFSKRFRCYTPDDMEEFKRIETNPNVVHYVGPEKPWLPSVRHAYEKDYFKYSRMTAFYKYIRWQKYNLYDCKVKSLTFRDIPLFIKTKAKGKTIYEILGIPFNFRTIKNFFIQELSKDSVYRIKLLGITVFKKKDTDEKRSIKLFGIPIYYWVKQRDKKKPALQDTFSDTYASLKADMKKILSELSEQKTFNKKLNLMVSNLKCIIEAQNLHPITFGKYKNAFAGKDVVLVCTGPTANKYIPIKEAIHVCVNGAIYLEHVSLDYLFVQDYTVHQKCNTSMNDDIKRYKGNECKKFYGIIPDESLSQSKQIVERIPLSYSFDENVFQYLLEDIPRHNIAYDISREPLGQFFGTAFSALQFILYTNPKRLYLVGWDCSAGYAYGKSNAASPANYQLEIFKTHFIPHIKTYHSDIEIISVNPVGLKGLFKDEFTDV